MPGILFEHPKAIFDQLKASLYFIMDCFITTVRAGSGTQLQGDNDSVL